jgi:hypothetical protein
VIGLLCVAFSQVNPVFFDILELDEDEDFSRMSTDPVLAYDDYRRKEKRLELIFKTSRPDLNIGDPERSISINRRVEPNSHVKSF